MSGNQPAGPSPSPWGNPAVAHYPPPGSGRRSLRGLATALTVLLCIIAAVELIAAIILFYRSSLLFDAADGDFPGSSEADAVDAGVAASVVLHILLALAIGVVFIVWQYRHAKNAENLGQSGGLGAGWAIGGWFVPFANLVLPAVQIFRSGQVSDDRPGRGPVIVVPWAILLGLAWLLQGVEAGLSPTDEFLTTPSDIEAAAASDVVGGFAMLVLIAAAVLCIVMVRSLTTRQDRALDARATVPPGYGAAAPLGQPSWNAPAQPWAGQPPPAQPWTAPSAEAVEPIRGQPTDAAPASDQPTEAAPAGDRSTDERSDDADPWRLPPG
jgi:hypothetical protein